VPVYLIRHAKAGHRGAWAGRDEDRPLSKNGWAQARAIAARFEGVAVRRLVSSPFRRCVETLEPLALATGLVIEVVEALAGGSPFDDALTVVEALEDDTVVCSHGDVIPAVLDALARRGLEISGPRELRKGSIWVLERAEGGRWTRAHTIAPPAGPDGD